MAGIADMIVGSALESAQKAPDISGAITKGAELAQTMQNMKVQRENLERQKQEHQMQKAIAVTDTLKIAASSKDQKLKNFLLKNVMPGKIKALGMEEFFPPQTMEMIQTSDAVQQKILGLQLDLDEKVRSGQMTGAQAYAEAQRILQDPEELAMLDTDQIFEAQKFKNSEEGKSARADKMARASAERAEDARDDAPTVTYKNKVAAEAASFNTAGGEAGLKTKIDKLDGVIAKLKEGKIKTRTLGAVATSAIGGRGQGALLPELKAAKATVNGAIDIKRILDSQFSDAIMKETQQNLGLDENLDNETNIERLESLSNQLKREVRSKVGEFRSLGLYRTPGGKSGTESTGTTAPVKKPWKGLTPAQKQGFSALPPGEKNKALKKMIELFDVDIDKLRKDLGL